MSHTITFALEHNRKRLAYYAQIKEKNTDEGKTSAAIDQWLEIYAERVQKLERDVTQLGLKAKIKPSSTDLQTKQA